MLIHVAGSNHLPTLLEVGIMAEQTVSDLEICGNEEWREVFDGDYAVSNLGRVKRLTGYSAGCFLKPETTNAGYRRVVCCVNNKRLKRSVHALVAMAFIGERPDGLQINHIDGDKKNNRVANLEYVTMSENMRHSYRVCGRKTQPCVPLMPGHSQGVKNPSAKLTEDQVREIRRRGDAKNESRRQIARSIGIGASVVTLIVNRKIWKHLPE